MCSDSFCRERNESFKALFCVQCLKDLKHEFLQKKERYDNLSSFSEMKAVLENLKKAMAWCLVRVSSVGIIYNRAQKCTFILLLIEFYLLSLRINESEEKEATKPKGKHEGMRCQAFPLGP